MLKEIFTTKNLAKVTAITTGVVITGVVYCYGMPFAAMAARWSTYQFCSMYFKDSWFGWANSVSVSEYIGGEVIKNSFVISTSLGSVCAKLCDATLSSDDSQNQAAPAAPAAPAA